MKNVQEQVRGHQPASGSSAAYAYATYRQRLLDNDHPLSSSDLPGISGRMRSAIKRTVLMALDEGSWLAWQRIARDLRIKRDKRMGIIGTWMGINGIRT